MTNASRGTVNTRRFCNTLGFVINLLCVKLGCALPAP
nr:DUF3265 domain-containing protein [Vibrio sp. gvc]